MRGERFHAETRRRGEKPRSASPRLRVKAFALVNQYDRRLLGTFARASMAVRMNPDGNKITVWSRNCFTSQTGGRPHENRPRGIAVRTCASDLRSGNGT